MSRLKVATYNVHGFVGTDGTFRPNRTRAVLHELNAQIIALQEVDSNEHHREVLDYLTQGSAWKYVEGHTLLREAGSYGNAVLTTLPVHHYQLLDISYKNREPRGAIDLSVQVNQSQLRIIATHLGLLPSERRFQTRKLLDSIGSPARAPEEFTLLMGDLNEWWLWGRPLRWLRSWFDSATSTTSSSMVPATYPTCCPLFALDRIWVHPRKLVGEISVHRSPLARIASDHYPLVASLHL